MDLKKESEQKNIAADKHARSQKQLHNMQDDQKLVQGRVKVLENELKLKEE